MKWNPVDWTRWTGFPEEEGTYLCQFDDDTIETFDFDPVELEANGYWGVPNYRGMTRCNVVAWMDMPEKWKGDSLCDALLDLDDALNKGEW